MKKPSPVIVDLQDGAGRYNRHVHISKLKPIDVEGPGSATSSLLFEMSNQTQRSSNTIEDEMADLEVELEAEGILRFKQISPLYDRVTISNPNTRRQTWPKLVTLRARIKAEATEAMTTKPQN